MPIARSKRFPSMLLLLACLMPARHAGAEWLVANRNTATGATSSFDTARAVRSGATLEVWTRSEGAGHKPALLDAYRRGGLSPTQVQTLDERFAYRLTKWRIDCDRRLARALAVADYDVNGDAFFVSEDAGPEGAIFPGSVQDAASRHLCAVVAPKKRK